MKADVLDQRNALIVMAMQAFVGAISRNVRMISLDPDVDPLVLHIYVRQESEQDREEAQDVADEMSILTERRAVVAHIHVVGDDELVLPPVGRAVTLYKEYL